jgi:hypothetical protein
MTEAQWLACDDPLTMLEFVRGRASDRKLQLLACACCRRIWHLPDGEEISRHAVEVAERYADGLASETEIEAAKQAAWAVWYPDEATLREQMGFNATSAFAAATGRSWELMQASIRDVLCVGGREESDGRLEPQRDLLFRKEAARMMRCVFGNIVHPVSVKASRLAWLDGTAVRIAEGCYDERACDPLRLAVLADALEEAGCTDDAILSHLRSAGPHVRGCWALDLILGKS